MRRTLDSVVAQTVPPTRWVIVDAGSTDATPLILREYARRYSWIKVVRRADRGHRAVDSGAVEAFNDGLRTLNLDEYAYIGKLDLDLDLPPRYFEELMRRMVAEPRLGTVSGKPYSMRDGNLVSERRSEDMSAGPAKFYRTQCFRDIGGLLPRVMWDAIDCHKARQLGWIARSYDEPDLNFLHLRPMDSSDHDVLRGRRRHGLGQYAIGSNFLYVLATCFFRATEPPYVLGGIHMLAGYVAARLRGEPMIEDEALRRFIRAYQRRALMVGRRRAVEEIEGEKAPTWWARHGAPLAA